MNRFFTRVGLAFLLWVSVFSSACSAAPFPPLVGVHGMEAVCLPAEKGWTWTAPGALFGVEAEPDGTLLFAGGTNGAFLLKEENGAWREVWNWESLDFKPGDLASAVAAERDPYGRPNLILAAEPGRKRIFLAEARAHQVKIRWEYPTSLPPRKARLCPDTGNFLVLSAESVASGPWRLDEIDFRQEKTVWGFGASTGSMHPCDVVRLKNGWTVLSDLSSGRVAAYDRKGHKVWVQTLVPAAPGQLVAFPLAVERTTTGAYLLASISKSDGSTQLFRMKPSTGEIVGRWDGGATPNLPIMDSIAPLSKGAKVR